MERVEIIGGELNGSRLDNAATEATMLRLLDAVNRMASNNGPGRASQPSPDTTAQRIQAAHNRSISDGTAQFSSFSQEIQGTSNIVKLVTGGFTGLLGSLFSLSAVNTGLGLAFSTATPKLSDFTNAIGDSIPIVGGIIKTLGNAMQADIDNFRELSSVGLNLGSDLTELRLSAAKAGLGLDDYKAAISNNSSMLATFGGSVADGARIFTEVATGVQSNFGKQLSNLGFSMGETAEFTAGFMKQQAALGRSQKLTSDQLTAGSYEYMLQLDMLARTTGLTRKQAEDALAAQNEDMRMKTIRLSGDTEAVKTMQAVLASTKDMDLKGMFTDFFATGGIAMTPMTRAMATFSPELTNATSALSRNLISQDQFNAVLRAESQKAKDRLVSEGEYAKRMVAMGNQQYVMLAKLAGAYDNHGKAITKEEQAQRDAVENQKASILDSDKALLDLRNTLSIALMPALKAASAATGDLLNPRSPFVTGIKAAAERLAQFVTDIGDYGFIEAISKLFSDAAPAMSNAIESMLDVMITALRKNSSFFKMITGETKSEKEESTKTAEKAELTALKNSESSLRKSVAKPGEGEWFVSDKGKETIKKAAEDKLKRLAELKEKYENDTAKSKQPTIGTPKPTTATKPVASVTAKVTPSPVPTAAGMNLQSQKTVQPASPEELEIAAKVATTTTPAEIKSITDALKTLDYNAMKVPDATVKSLETGTLKLAALRVEVNSLRTAFKQLDDVGLDKITKGLERLDSSFKNFNDSFVNKFIPAFDEMDKKSQETLLMEANGKLDQMNNGITALIGIQQEAKTGINKTARNTKGVSGIF